MSLSAMFPRMHKCGLCCLNVLQYCKPQKITVQWRMTNKTHKSAKTNIQQNAVKEIDTDMYLKHKRLPRSKICSLFGYSDYRTWTWGSYTTNSQRRQDGFFGRRNKTKRKRTKTTTKKTYLTSLIHHARHKKDRTVLKLDGPLTMRWNTRAR